MQAMMQHTSVNTACRGRRMGRSSTGHRHILGYRLWYSACHAAENKTLGDSLFAAVLSESPKLRWHCFSPFCRVSLPS